MQPDSGELQQGEEVAAVGLEKAGEPVEVQSGLRALWREWWQWGSVLHLVFLLLLLVTPSVAGALGGRTWGALLGAAAVIPWLLFGGLGGRGDAGCFYFQAGLIGILLQVHYQLSRPK